MISSTGTSISTYLKWVESELEKKLWGEVSIKFVVCKGQVVDVRRESVDTDHFQLKKDMDLQK